MSEGWHPCLKQLTRCMIFVDNSLVAPNQKFEATNSCHVEGAEVCPRVTAGSPSGEGYDLCGPPKHAEQEAVLLLKQVYPTAEDLLRYGGTATAYLYGHTWMCMDCQHALVEAGVRTHVITGKPA